MKIRNDYVTRCFENFEGKAASLCGTNMLDLGQSPSERDQPQPKACVLKQIVIFGMGTLVTEEISSPVLDWGVVQSFSLSSTGPASLAGPTLCYLAALGDEENRLVVPPPQPPGNQPTVWGRRAGSTSLGA